MKPYLFIYEYGNGYHCHCCRHVTKETAVKNFASDEEAIAEANRESASVDDQRVLEVYCLQTENPIHTNT
jgi:hypothetical protein